MPWQSPDERVLGSLDPYPAWTSPRESSRRSGVCLRKTKALLLGATTLGLVERDLGERGWRYRPAPDPGV